MTKRAAMAVLASLSFVVIHEASMHVPVAQTTSGNVVLGSVNVNTASEGELRRVPGLRRSDVRRILNERRLAPFASQDDLFFLETNVPLRYIHFDGPTDFRLIRHAPAPRELLRKIA